jgi:NADH-quinone oxidoreductase subunit N
LMDLGVFGMLGTLSEPRADLDELVDFQGLGHSHPWRSGIFGFCLLSLAGLPPTAGFLGKILLFWAVIRADFIFLAIIGIITAVISIYFYFKVLVALYLRAPLRELPIPRADFAVGLAGGTIFILIFWLGTYPAPLLSVIEKISGFFLR